MSDVFVPGGPVGDCYLDGTEALLETRLTAAFEHCMGVPHSILATDFRAFVMDVFRTEAPRLRCSAARAIMEGRYKGIPRPAEGYPSNTKKQLKQFLLLCDVFETISRHYEEQLSELKTKADNEASESAKKILGTTQSKKRKTEPATTEV